MPENVSHCHPSYEDPHVIPEYMVIPYLSIILRKTSDECTFFIIYKLLLISHYTHQKFGLLFLTRFTSHTGSMKVLEEQMSMSTVVQVTLESAM